MKKIHPSAEDRRRARALRARNPQLAADMAAIYRSSRATPHTDRRAEARKGHAARGGRAGSKAALRTAQWERDR